MQARQPGDSSLPSKEHNRNDAQDSQSPPLQQQPRRSKSQQSRTETHYELEFDNESSVYARKLIVDAERVSLRSNMAEYGNHRHSTSFASHHSSRSRCPSTSSDIPDHQHIPFPPLSPLHPSYSPTRLTKSTNNNSASVQTSPERERRKSREELSLLRQVPENGDPMEFHSEQPTRRRDSTLLLEGVRELQDGGGDDQQRFGRQVSVRISESPTPEDADEAEEEEEEEQWILDEELARQGLYRGSYRQLIGIYTLTPTFTLLVFFALACLPSIAYPLKHTPITYPYAPYLPYPLPEFLTATAFWALSYLLTSSLFSLFSSSLSSYIPLLLQPYSHPLLTHSFTSLIQSTITITLRQTLIPILLISCGAGFDHPTWHDSAFRRTWWTALGWAAAEAVVGVKQGYEGVALYRDVLVSVRRVAKAPGCYPKQQQQQQQKQQEQGQEREQQSGIPLAGYGGVGVLNSDPPRRRASPPLQQYTFDHESDAERQPLLHERHTSNVGSIHSDTVAVISGREAIEEEVERDVDELIALRGRGELEDLYGMPFIHLPAFIPCLHRLNSALFTLGSFLLITAAYMRSSLSLKLPLPLPSPTKILFFLLSSTSSSLQQHNNDDDPDWPRLQGNTQLFLTFSIVVFLHWALALLHTPYVLPRIGVHTFVYVGLLVSLGVFFAGLGVWEGIV